MRTALEHRWQAALGIACGLGLGSAIAWMRNAEMKYVVALAGGLLFLVALLMARRAERLCLLAFVAAIPLPMHAFLYKLDPMHAGGALGAYLVAADLPLAGMYLFWFLDWARGAAGPRPRPLRYAVFLLPFLLFSGMSIAWSSHPVWAVCEWLRWVKVLLIVIYAARRLRREDIPACTWTLMASACLESAIATMQSLTHSNLGLDKLGVFGAGGEQAVTQQLATGGMLFRGSALTGHPNFLATYLLLTLPMLALVGLMERRPLRKVLWYGGFLVCLAGLAGTMSRAAWVSFAIAAALAFAAAVAQHLIPIKRSAILLLSALAIAGIAGLSLQNLILERFHADWNESWKLRVELNEAAMAMAQDHLVGGVGLNNYTAEFPQYDPEMADLMMKMDNMLTVVHNTYLLIWAEVGTLGLAAFACFVGGAFWRGGRALHSMAPKDRALALGILAGIFGALLFDLTEISLWMEIGMYSLGFWIGVLEPLSGTRVYQPAPVAVSPMREAVLQS
jgi:putative inorganic carbon (hco3(-)) transporter